MNKIDEINKLIIKGHTEDALKLLHSEENYNKEFMILSSRLWEVKNQFNSGIIDTNEYTILLNKVKYDLIGVIRNELVATDNKLVAISLIKSKRRRRRVIIIATIIIFLISSVAAFIVNSYKNNNGYHKRIIGEATYEGYLIDGKKHGAGKLIYNDGVIFEGEFRDNKANGNGSIKQGEVAVISGIFENDTLKRGDFKLDYSSASIHFNGAFNKDTFSGTLKGNAVTEKGDTIYFTVIGKTTLDSVFAITPYNFSNFNFENEFLPFNQNGIRNSDLSNFVGTTMIMEYRSNNYIVKYNGQVISNNLIDGKVIINQINVLEWIFTGTYDNNSDAPFIDGIMSSIWCVRKFSNRRIVERNGICSDLFPNLHDF